MRKGSGPLAGDEAERVEDLLEVGATEAGPDVVEAALSGDAEVGEEVRAGAALRPVAGGAPVRPAASEGPVVVGGIGGEGAGARDPEGAAQGGQVVRNRPAAAEVRRPGRRGGALSQARGSDGRADRPVLRLTPLRKVLGHDDAARELRSAP